MATDKLDKNPADKLKMVLRQPEPRNFPAITDPARFGQMPRACDRYAATPVVRAALKLAPMLLLRPGELRFAEWPEIDLDAALWTVPAARMKREVREKLLGAPHLVPLPHQAVTVLRELHELTGHATMVFRGERHHHRAMSENTINARCGRWDSRRTRSLATAFAHLLGRCCTRGLGSAPRSSAWADYLDPLRIDGDAVPMRAPAPKPSIAPASVIATPPPSPPGPAERPVVASVSPSPMEKQELSTIEAAKFLNASHLFIAQEIDAGRLECRQVGVDWRIAVSDLVTLRLASAAGQS